MILNQQYNLLYIINPRVASTSICSQLGFPVENRPFIPVDDIKIFYGEDWYNINKFTFVRNPYTRIVSDYFQTYFGTERANRLDPLEFDDWFDSLNNAPRLVDEPLVFGGKMTLHKPPQVSFISEDINYIGRYEKLSEHWTEMLNLFGLGAEKATHWGFKENDNYVKELFNDLPTLRASSAIYYTVEKIEETLLPKTIKKINLLYKDDFDNPYFRYPKIEI
jgi:hypothetical protein